MSSCLRRRSSPYLRQKINNMKKIFENNWQELLQEEMEQSYYKTLREILIDEYKNETIYPDKNSIFNALHYTDYYDVKAVGPDVSIIKPGDVVMVSWARMTPPFTHEGEKYGVTSEKEIWAVVEL